MAAGILRTDFACGAGCNYEAYTNMRADSNSDSIVTLQEAYVYTRNYCINVNNNDSNIPSIDMAVQVYPANSTYPLFRR